MLYYVAFLIRGEAAEYHNSIAVSISQLFGERKYANSGNPSHVTLIPPFTTKSIDEIESIMLGISLSYNKSPALLDGFGHFRRSVIFMNIELSDEAYDLQKSLTSRIIGMASFRHNINGREWHPHATLSYCSSHESFVRIWRYLNGLERKGFTIEFDNIALLVREGGKWRVHKEYALG